MAEIKYNSNSLTEEIVKRTIEDTAPQAITNKGGYSYINGSLIPNALSKMLARAYRAGRIFRPGIGMTEEFVASINPDQVNNVTVQLQTNMGVHVRTLRDGSNPGTPNNDGLINTNRKLIPSTTPFNIPLRQIADQPLFFPRLMTETMVFDEIAETIANYYDNEVNGNDSYHLAKMVSYAMYRAAQSQSGTETDPSTYGDNIIVFDTSTGYTQGAGIKLLNDITALMANGDPQTNLGTFKGRRQFTATAQLLGYINNPYSGLVIPGTEQGAGLFYRPGFDLNESMRTGEQFRFAVKGYDFYEMNGQTLSFAEKWLNLPAGSLDGVLGVISTPLSYASGGVSKKSIRLLQSTENDGVVGFPFTKYGGTAYRQIFLIVSSDWTVPTKLQKTNTINAPAAVIAPTSFGDVNYEPIERVVYDANGNPTGVETIANVLAPNGDTTCAVVLSVFGTDNVPLTGATLAPTVNSVAVPYTNNADGTYTIVVPKGSAIAGSITVAGYSAGTINVTAAQTSGWNYATAVTLTASD